MIYLRFIRFLFPLVLTILAAEFGGQVLNGGMARMPQATATLASYGLAWGLVSFLSSPLLQIRQVGLVLVDSLPTLRKVRWVTLVSGLALAGVLALLALSPLGVWVIEVLHGLEHPLSTVAREVLLWLVPVPILSGLLRLYSGTLLRARRTDVVSAAALVAIGARIGAVFALLPAAFVQAKPIWLPLGVTYAGTLVELAVTVWGYRRFVRRDLPEAGKVLSYRYVLTFFWPLALIMAVQGLSRPLINLFVSRRPDGAAALAVLTIVYALGHLPYGWLNDMRSLPTAFKEEKDSLIRVRRFALACGLAVFASMLALYWTPLSATILRAWIGVDDVLAARARVPLMIFAFFPLVVMVRAYLHGVGLLEHRTRALAPSGPVRIGAILVALILLSATPAYGATVGVAALLSGFVLETVAVWWGVRGPGLARWPSEGRSAREES